ncbi:MAG: hypothetical protein IPK73_20925 [Candidatus Obscuribacter sp.]|nr:hypothetical protein [Candidatus Obscuribacter sp.]MBK9276581.1 hypothetical protein [Candidatus Obscuribacter sp.]
MTQRPRSRRLAGHTAELPLVLLMLFGVFAFPLIDIIALALAYSTVWFIAFQSAAAASTQTDLSGALSALVKQSSTFNGNGLTSMLKMTPAAGYKNTGTNLYVNAVDFMDTGKSQTIGPNKAVPPPVDLTNHFYEISAESTYEVKPFIDLQAVPLLSYVQGLGAPIKFTVTVTRCAEFPQGLVRGPADPSSTPASAVQPAPHTTSFASPVETYSRTTDPWNRPRIYDEIKAAGQQIIDHTVVQVKAANPNWTDTGITVGPGQMIWLDFRADGEWGQRGYRPGMGNGDRTTTADGITGYDNPMGPAGDQKAAPAYALVGVISPAGVKMEGSKFDFLVGSTLYKYTPQKTGPLSLGCNCPLGRDDPATEGQLGNIGAYGVMTVRIIVTQSYI